MADLYIKLLGKIEISWQGYALKKIPKKSLALLAYLASENRTISREHMAEILWGIGKLNNLRQGIHSIRQLDGSDIWFIDGESLEIRAKTDLSEFEDLFENKKYKQAIEIYDGDFLEGLEIKDANEFNTWLELNRIRIKELYHLALTNYLAELEKNKEYQKALDLAQKIVAADPLNETIYRSIMILENKLGNTEKALEAFEKLRQNLHSEMALEPSEETLDLLKEIEQGANQLNLAQIISKSEDIPHLPKKLIGRADELVEIKKQLKQEKRLLVQGFGGSGKTAIVATVAKDYLRNNNLLWLELGNADFQTALASILQAFEVSSQNLSNKDLIAKIAKVFKENKISLLVLDNVWNAYSLSKIIELMPENLAILVSSRQRYPKIARISLSNLKREDAIELVNFYAGRKLAKAENLAEYLGDHAFALKIAASTIKREKISTTKLIQRIKAAPLDLRIPSELADGPDSMSALLKVSLEALDEDAYEVFLAFGALASLSSTSELISYLINRDIDLVENALYELLKRGLLERMTTVGSDSISYKVHNLSFSYLKYINNIRNKTFVHACLSYLKNHKDEPELLDSELDNIIAAAETAKKLDTLSIMQLLVSEGNYFDSRGHNTRSLALLDKAIEIAKSQEEFNIAHDLLGKRGDIYTNYLGDNAKALASYKEALEFAKLSKNKAREAIFLNVIGVMLFYQNDSEADSYFAQAIEAAKKAEDDLSLATILEQQGFVEGLKENHQQAKSYFQDALAAILRLKDNELLAENELNKREFFAIYNLGQSVHDLGDYEQSISYRVQALAIAEEQDNELWVALCYYALGESYLALKDNSKTTEYLNKALDLYKKNGAIKYIDSLNDFMHANNINVK